MWKKIPGMKYDYYINDIGMVRKKTGDKYLLLKPQKKKTDTEFYEIIKKNGKKIRCSIFTLLHTYFIGPVEKGYYCVPKDGDYKNTRVSNVGCKRFGSQGVKIQVENLKTGEKTIYKSFTDASKDLFYCHQYISEVERKNFIGKSGFCENYRVKRLDKRKKV